MARCTQREAMAMRESILDAAEWCFRTHGVAATTIARIAARAGCTRGGVYWHFRDQQALLQAVLERGFPLLSDRLHAALAEQPPLGLAGLHTLLRGFIDGVAADGHARSSLEIVLHRCEFSGPASQSTRDFCAREEVQVLDALLACFAQAQARGELAPGLSPQDCAGLVMLTLLGAWKASFLATPGWPFEPDIHAALALLFTAFGGPVSAEKRSSIA